MIYSSGLLPILLIFAYLNVNISYGFGANRIAQTSSMKGRAYRHGDLDDQLVQISLDHYRDEHYSKQSTVSKKLPPLSKEDVKKIYFGNWLRDMSQIIDVSLVKAFNHRILVSATNVLSMIKFGVDDYFEVTKAKLGCTRPEEHIDNPKGYPKEAQKFLQCLRPPVSEAETEVDPKTGIKRYVTTTVKYLDVTLKDLIKAGRDYLQAGSSQNDYFITLGRVLHTVQDWYAHSNTVELHLQQLGYRNVYAYVGNDTKMIVPGLNNGKPVYPVVTGKFGTSDAIVSLIGELQDTLGESIVPDAKLEKELNAAEHSSFKMNQMAKETDTKLHSIVKKCFSGMKKPFSKLFNHVKGKLFKRSLSKPLKSATIEHDETQPSTPRISETKPSTSTSKKSNPSKPQDGESCPVPPKFWQWKQLKDLGLHRVLMLIHRGLDKMQRAVIKVSAKHQDRIFRDSHDTDPTHSRLSKDHFNNRLNQLAGECAIRAMWILVPTIFTAIEDGSNASLEKASDIMKSVFVHPATTGSVVNDAISKTVAAWVDRHNDLMDTINGQPETHKLINSLSHDSVKDFRNLRSVESLPRFQSRMHTFKGKVRGKFGQAN